MNKSITMTLPHGLAKQEARRRVEDALGQLQQQAAQVRLASFAQSWQGDRASFVTAFLGQEVRGHVDVLDQTVNIEVELPGFLALLAETVRGRLQTEGRKLLAKNAGK